MTDASPNNRKRELIFFFLFALAISLVNMRYVDMTKGATASEWMTAINILESPEDYPNSLQYGFFKGINTFSENAGVALHRDFGVSISVLDKAQVFLQVFFIVFGAWLLCLSLGRDALAAATAVILIFASCFTSLGRYLNLSVTYIPTHSAVAFAVGLFILGLFANGKRILPVFLSCVLFIWHPSHSVIIHSFMWVFMAVNFKREGGLEPLAKYAAVNFLCLIPSVYSTLPQFTSLSAPMSPASVSLWWALLEARTTNIFPLNDGALTIANVWMSLAAGYFMLFISSATRPKGAAPATSGGARFAIFVLIWIAVLWALQIAASQFLHIMPITRLALTRCTPYAAVYVCIFAASAVEDLLHNRDKRALAFPFIAVILGLLVRLQSPLLAAFLALYAARFMQPRNARAFRLAGASCLFLLLTSGLLIHALDTFELFTGGGLYVPLRQLCAAALFASLLLALAILAAAAFVLLFQRGSLINPDSKPETSAHPLAAPAVIAIITIAALSTNLLMLSRGAKYDLRFIEFQLRDNAKSRLDLQRWAASSTPRGAMFIMNPLKFAGFEQTARRPGFIEREEMHYPLYAVGLLDEIVYRLKIMGVDVNDKEFAARCNLLNSLKFARCRQSLLYEKIETGYPAAVIANTPALLSKYKNARYLIIEKGKTVPAAFAAAHPVVYNNEIFQVYDLRP